MLNVFQHLVKRDPERSAPDLIGVQDDIQIKMNKDNLDNLRHSCAHLLAAAVMRLWPDTKRTIGPAIDNGFYFDFEFSNPISEKDFPKIEAKMRELVKNWHSFERHVLDVEAAKKEYPDNEYKHELIDEFSQKGEKLTFYKSGEYWDLCKGGHCENPSKELKHLKLLSIAGAYWRGSEKNKMLTRIYGTCFPTKEELDAYVWQQEEAKKRDHKRLGKELDLFVFSDLVGPGLPLWTPKGTVLRILLDDYVWKLRNAKGYERVEIPHITKKELYQASGHWDKFKDELFKITTREGHEFAMKPMNCPHHTQIYNHVQRSYKDLPQRYANTTTCYRDEQTGELSGLSRVRAFTQDDAHVFCRKSQIKQEFLKVWDIIDTFYSSFGFKLSVRLSLHDPNNMDAYLGDKKIWEYAENALIDIAESRKISYQKTPGEAAFYGPKIDFMARDSLGREWQVATIQLDMNMPERFDLFCINESGEQERIVMIHAAIMGSIERFLSILIEHYAGAFPLWLAPVQIAVLPVSEKHLTYAQKISQIMERSALRVYVYEDNKTLSAKIRDATLQKIPYVCIIGDKEMSEKDMVSVRTRTGENLGTQSIMEFIKKLEQDIEKKL